MLTLSLLGLVACGSDASTTATTAAASEATGADADKPATTNAPAVPADVANSATDIIVTVGTDDIETTGGKRVISVPKGTSVNVRITDPNSDEEYHFHVVDVEATAKKGETSTISFVANQTGQYDLESHTTDATLLVILVV